MFVSRVRSVVLPLLLCGSLAQVGSGQATRGQLTSRETGAPVAGAVIQLLDERGQVQARALTDSSGVFALQAAAAGRFRVRVDRIGLATETSGWIDLAPGEVRDHPMKVSSQSIPLEGITVSGRSRGCSIRDNARTVARVWDEARKALDAITLTQSAARVRFDTESFRRELDPQTLSVRAEQRRSSFDHTENPFRSVPIEELEERGYVRTFADSTVYYAPDAGVLLSDAFLDTHCFRITGERASDDGLIGLEFSPRGRPSRADIAGTLWVDLGTSELRSVDYRYVGHRLDVPAELLGGRIEFERVQETGAWIVRRWVVRMPVVRRHTVRFTNPTTFRAEERTETTVTALIEQGGEVVAISNSGPTRAPTGQAEISGTVTDSVAGTPLPGATVFLSGTSLTDTTDASGRYRIVAPTDRQYVVSFLHPHLVSFGITPTPRRIELRPASTATVDLAIPSIATMLQQHCPSINAEDPRAAVVGYVRETRSGEPVPGARVRAKWMAKSELRAGSLPRSVDQSGEVVASADNAWIDSDGATLEVVTDESGFYRLCGFPAQSSLELRVQWGRSSVRRSMSIGRELLTVEDVFIERPPAR